MKLGFLTVLYADRSLHAVLDRAVELGVDAIELGTGNYPGDAHCRPDELLGDHTRARELRRAVAERGLQISALSCHGNPLHPQTKIARDHHDTFMRTLDLAKALDVNTVITFSGCPPGDAKAGQPSWIVSPWPPEFSEMLAWQWKERVEPYWKDTAKAAKKAGVRVAIEMHPNFVVYNPETMMRLRDLAPGTIGCNFDPSHMFWQGVDVVKAIRTIGDAIYHVHAKDCRIDPRNVSANGVLDAKKYTRELERSWIFRTCGYGNDATVWKDIVSNLRLVGYDHVLSIEHEDSIMSPAEGLKKAVAFLRDVVIAEPAGEAYWA